MCEVIDAYINTGLQQGLQQGEINGKIIAFADFVRDGIITEEEAAKRANMTIEEFEKAVKEIEKLSEDK